ncbi:P-II family nitrogen regulator [Gulosibacter sediminis]|uniref:P-II family nitrogen regulator n=1 Tax=Gulosibacter sediminis TaxID=1729695 RepID=UPI0024A7E46C|nr:P-II family nitrogen regulator [Gulosibacter sediminis]
MKLITAILQPSVLVPVKLALAEHGVKGITVTDARGHGTQAGKTEFFRGQTYTVDFVDKVRLEIVVTDETVDAVVETIADAARTGEIGDGKIWVADVVSVVRVRTGQTGDDAIN